MTEEKKVPWDQAAANTSDAPRPEESGVRSDAAAAVSVINSVNLEAASHLAASATPTGDQAEAPGQNTGQAPAQAPNQNPDQASHQKLEQNADQSTGQSMGQSVGQNADQGADQEAPEHSGTSAAAADAAAAGDATAAPDATAAGAAADATNAAAPGSADPADAGPVGADAADPAKTAADETTEPAAAGAGGQPPQPPASPFTPDASEPTAPVPAVSGGQPPATPDEEDEEEADGPDRPMGLMDHLGELRTRLVRCSIAVIVGFFACWAVVDPIFDVLVNPLLAVLPKGSHAIYTTLPEAFFTRMHIAFVAGVFLSSPMIFYQVWSFIAPGLYEEEKKYIIPIAVMSALFFICGGAFCYFVVFPYAFSFFVSFATEEIVAMPKVSDYLSFVLKLILAFGIIFEMPLFAFFLARMGVVTAAMMRKVRRYAILSIFIVAAILTPPDVVSQLLMACPMLILYEISIWVAAAFGRKPKTEKNADDGGQEKPDAAATADATNAKASEEA